MEQSLFYRLMQAQLQFQEEMLRKRNVVGTAVGYKDEAGNVPALVVLVEEKKPLAALSADDLVPIEVNGVRTDVMEVGYLRAQQNPREKFRPIPNGVSIGHYKVTAGTLGAVVFDRTTGEKFILSNNHVLANSNEALQGDALLQPAAMDGGNNPGDQVATLDRFIPLNYLEGPVGPPNPTPRPPTPTPGPAPDPTPEPPGCDFVNVFVGLANLLAKLSGSQKRVQMADVAQMAQAEAASVSPQVVASPVMSADAQVAPNLVDAALGRPIDPNQFTGETLQIGSITGTKAPEIGMRVRKFGRTTAYTEGTVNLLNATVNVAYNTSQGNRTARFTGQVITTAMSQGGDSGSLIVDASAPSAVGLLFAGSALATIFTPIDAVLDALNVRF